MPNAATVFTAQCRIARPPAEVWAALVDWDLAPRWMGELDELRADGPLAVGTVLRFRARGKEQTSTIEEVDPQRRLVLGSQQGPFTAAYRYDLRPADGDASCDVELVVTLAARGPSVVIAPLVRFAIRRADAHQLDRLAACLAT